MLFAIDTHNDAGRSLLGREICTRGPHPMAESAVPLHAFA